MRRDFWPSNGVPWRDRVPDDVSRPRLQELFHERGHHASDWIWTRRLTVAAQRLTDPASVHLPIGTLAYECGFFGPAHFSRRFRDRHGLSRRAYRDAASLRSAGAARGLGADGLGL
ncbi:AraC family transcriptional regulator [Methylobacterium mesophilicum SR1.6/6]|uniref:AraC family transcriptional regulator n=1 Tax=Methylobacterium mesophilicum SR1.6/6 TaxID=908290 RepID=A0A6B9FRV6_9HYPH|nr:AraC family transcriptional regulator [Methylobacterium mesophilicum SR1.6/6]